MTALTFRGEAELAIAGLQVLGVRADESAGTLRAFLKEQGWQGGPDEVPAGELIMTVRVCADCASRAGFPVGQPPGPIPTIGVPDGGER
jgi:hypothetical protein